MEQRSSGRDQDRETRLWCHSTFVLLPPRSLMRHRLLSRRSGRCTFTCQRRKNHISKTNSLRNCRCRCHRRMGSANSHNAYTYEVTHSSLHHTSGRRIRRHTYDGNHQEESGGMPGEYECQTLDSLSTNRPQTARCMFTREVVQKNAQVYLNRGRATHWVCADHICINVLMLTVPPR
jgi:hypothetical protein